MTDRDCGSRVMPTARTKRRTKKPYKLPDRPQKLGQPGQKYLIPNSWDFFETAEFLAMDQVNRKKFVFGPGDVGWFFLLRFVGCPKKDLFANQRHVDSERREKRVS
ncbi:MAG: hypothetical protein WA705_24060 [Candidatus Ozemobacteraceae bacterium]